MPILYFHIGLPKTGTSGIQKFMVDHHEELYPYTRLYYPSSGRLPHPFIHKSLFPIKKYKHNWTALRNELNTVREADVLISEELISLHIEPVPVEQIDPLILSKNSAGYLNKRTLSFVQELFPEYTIKFILCLRRVDDFARSDYAQVLKNFRSTSYRDFFNYLYGIKHASLFHSKLIESIHELIGKENLTIFMYSKENVVKNFFDALQMEIPEGYLQKAQKIRVNLSFPSASLPFLSRSLLPEDITPETRKSLSDIVRASFTMPSGKIVGQAQLAEFSAEIDKVGEYFPEYKKSFGERDLNFSFPEVDEDPYKLLQTSLLYRVYSLQAETKKSLIAAVSPEQDLLLERLSALEARQQQMQAQLETILQLITKLPAWQACPK